MSAQYNRSIIIINSLYSLNLEYTSKIYLKFKLIIFRKYNFINLMGS